MRNFIFYEEDTDEVCIVEASSLKDATATALKFFPNAEFQEEVDDETAEMLGYDTY